MTFQYFYKIFVPRSEGPPLTKFTKHLFVRYFYAFMGFPKILLNPIDRADFFDI